MGTPVKIRAREEQCVGAGPCGDPRPMTKEEMLKYYTKEEIEGMSGKITPPEKEKLIEVLAEVEGKTKAIYHASKVLQVSSPVIYRWLKEYGIQFDADGKVIQKSDEVTPVYEGTPLTVEIDGNTITHSGEKLIMEAANQASEIKPAGTVNFKNATFVMGPCGEMEIENTITVTGQETKEIPKRLGYAEHDIGNATLQIDFRKELVKIITPDNDEMTFEEAIAAAELILDILGHE